MPIFCFMPNKYLHGHFLSSHKDRRAKARSGFGIAILIKFQPHEDTVYSGKFKVFEIHKWSPSLPLPTTLCHA